MLSSERELALNDILTPLKDTADLYAEGARLSETPELATLLEELHQIRRNQAAHLEEHIRSLGYFPAEPDADRETVSHLFWQFKTALSSRKMLALIDRFQKAEREIERQIEKAFHAGIRADTREVLGYLRSVTQGAQKRLAEARAGIEST